MPVYHEKILLVEGDEDKRVIPELIEANGIKWGESKQDHIVYIKSCDGIDNLLDKNLINTELKASSLKIIGIIIDADEHPHDRWQSIRNCIIDKFPDIPENIPDTGLIHHPHDEIKIGIWMMPDNKERGMLETFLKILLPNNDDELWKLTENSCQKASEIGAPFKDYHIDKAKIHTWLSWQNPPGRQLHNAIMERILDPKSPYAAPFINWFQELYEVSIT